MSTACERPQGEGVRPMWTEGGGRKPDFFGRHKWMAPYIKCSRTYRLCTWYV